MAEDKRNQEYSIVSTDKLFETQQAVRDLIEAGWELMGGVSVAMSHSPNGTGGFSASFCFAQAMVRRTKDETE